MLARLGLGFGNLCKNGVSIIDVAKRSLNEADTDNRTVSVNLVGAAAFRVSSKQDGAILGTVTLDGIDHELQKRGRPAPCQDALGDLRPRSDDLESILSHLPLYLCDQAAAFSRVAADTLPPHRPFDHKLRFDKEPEMKASHLYKMSTRELEAMREYLIKNLRKGFIRLSSSSFSLLVLFVKKKNGDLRFCIDYRSLNELTKKDRYPLSLISETLSQLAYAMIFTKLDIRHAFNRIRIDPDLILWALFRTTYGAFEPVVLPFSLCNGPAIFQRYINSVLIDYLSVFCTAYIDDILIFSKDKKEHRQHVRQVVIRLRAAGLYIDIKKCEFEVTRTTFLGYVIIDHGVEVDPSKTKVIRN
ncbi:hypothetical protein EPUS_09218 [Endocarpon pusillum Z07020]|uniref:Reverse transcriptase domain-containing protein n=1 Tax=Endocarpon pusillum (strain Z07020 / HMAS-L-300199) TaxID=1263415 RepID=U1GFF3_ENDPU|nr:uncharacterized protein EPUS_09218 [Endocarpon pusillum Z07020]ERF70476.1 hypothetical protein EPUS_09218 [Endocarpon pusillum Z07020]